MDVIRLVGRETSHQSHTSGGEQDTTQIACESRWK